MDKEKLDLEITIEYEYYQRKEIKEKIYDFLKELDVTKLEMEEK